MKKIKIIVLLFAILILVCGCDVTNNNNYTMNVTQCIRKDNYRVFYVSLRNKDNNDIYKEYEFMINRYNASVLLYENK